MSKPKEGRGAGAAWDRDYEVHENHEIAENERRRTLVRRGHTVKTQKEWEDEDAHYDECKRTFSTTEGDYSHVQ